MIDNFSINSIKSELKKVSWPDREKTIKFTIIVIAVSLIIALYIGIIDFLLVKLLDFLTL
ncbi:MAG: hypothetical protein KatS3mg090_0652 [Patescibacteria group bacterium]|nr:MAG: hypothetical protein KatS3mg090_0652 [Patescibacteria group bacterium]